MYTFTINDSNSLLYHFVVNDTDIAQAIAESDEWKDHQTFTATVEINGVTIPARVFETVLNGWMDQIDKRVRDEADLLTKHNAVEHMAIALNDERKKEIFDKLDKLEFAIDALLEVSC